MDGGYKGLVDLASQQSYKKKAFFTWSPSSLGDSAEKLLDRISHGTGLATRDLVDAVKPLQDKDHSEIFDRFKEFKEISNRLPRWHFCDHQSIPAVRADVTVVASLWPGEHLKLLLHNSGYYKAALHKWGRFLLTSSLPKQSFSILFVPVPQFHEMGLCWGCRFILVYCTL